MKMSTILNKANEVKDALANELDGKSDKWLESEKGESIAEALDAAETLVGILENLE